MIVVKASEEEATFRKRLYTHKFTHPISHTQAHLQSARAVADGRADIASLDAVSWRLLQTHEAFSRSLRVLQWTAPTPGLPLISAKALAGAGMFTAVDAAIKTLDEQDRQALGICGLVKIPKSDYLSVRNPDLPECYSHRN